MEKFNLPLVAESLTAYAIERQNGFERHQPAGTPPWTERRRFWTDVVLQGMARLEGREPDMTIMERYDYELEKARSSLTSPASARLQNGTIRELRSYVSALETSGDDRRRQINAVRELLEDMASHLPWAGAGKALDRARDEADRALARMTAQMPIRFTRIFMGGDSGPWASGFESGCLHGPEAVKGTAVYQDAAQTHPGILDEWLLYPLKEAEARDVLELIEARNKVASTIFCSQFDTGEWHENLYDPILADAICDRIVYNAYTIQIEGESMRRRKGIPE